MRAFRIGLRALLPCCLALPVSGLAQEVAVYSAREPQLLQPVLDAFTRSTGIKVRSIFIPNGLEERIRAEGQASPADVIVLVDVARLVAAKQAGLTRPVASPVLDSAVPAHLRDRDGHWFATTLRARIVYASRERVTRDAITYEELADPEWHGRICIRSGQHPYNVSLFAAAIARMGPEKATAWLRGLKANLARRPSGGDREVAKDILAGVCDIGIANTYYLGLMRANEAQRAWGEAVKPLRTTFRDGGTMVNISGAALARHAPHEAEAVKLLEFMVGPQAQKLYADLNVEYPVRADAVAAETTRLFGPIAADTVRLEDLATHQRAASELVDRLGFDR